jgi:hypothetical protein
LNFNNVGSSFQNILISIELIENDVKVSLGGGGVFRTITSYVSSKENSHNYISMLMCK